MDQDAKPAENLPYLYWCEVGRHEWKCKFVEPLVPPAMDGATCTCPVHSEVEDE